MNTTPTNVSSASLNAKAERLATIQASLLKRHRKETRFRLMGLFSVSLALIFVAILFGSILSRGLPAFWQSVVTVEVFFDPEILEIEEKPTIEPGEVPAVYQARLDAWTTDLSFADWNKLLEASVLQVSPSSEPYARELRRLFTSGERFRLRDMVLADPDIIGQRREISMLADANVDVWLRGNIDRSLPDDQQQMSPELRALADKLKAEGIIELKFSTSLFSNPDSRSSLASAGLAGAIVGSLFMMLIVIFISVPIGVASAIYLEEFAPKNRITDLVEVNINNLAAVPSIVFGLLGAAIFINWLSLPISAPLVGGLVLSLMTLPTVIITTRASLRAVPPSIRQAALGVGASKVQMVFHHVLPLAIPGILTGAILGVAQALGETAPLLLVGMSAFVASIPATPLDQSSALPVQIYLWQANELRNFFEGRTAAAIVVLLGVMLMLNGFAIWLRKKLEIRW